MYTRKNLVCFGGGTGLPSLLSGLKENPWFDVSAIVSMFDSGGSSGVLRDRFGILQPGDILKCLLALSVDPQHARKILLRRIKHAVHDGHTGGNILLMGLEQVYGNYEDAVNSLGQLLSITGRVIPVSLDKSALCAEGEDGSVAFGETEVDAKMRSGVLLNRIFLEPSASATQTALSAISKADAICIGPGSFYTSILPNFLPSGIALAIASSKAPIVFIANLLTEGRGMENMALSDLIAILEKRIGRRVDIVVANSAKPTEKILAAYAEEGKAPLKIDIDDGHVILSELWTDPNIARHDSVRLAGVVAAAIDRLKNR